VTDSRVQSRDSDSGIPGALALALEATTVGQGRGEARRSVPGRTRRLRRRREDYKAACASSELKLIASCRLPRATAPMCSWERRDEEEDGAREGKISARSESTMDREEEHDGAKLDGETKRRAERRLVIAIERQRKSGSVVKHLGRLIHAQSWKSFRRCCRSKRIYQFNRAPLSRGSLIKNCPIRSPSISPCRLFY